MEWRAESPLRVLVEWNGGGLASCYISGGSNMVQLTCFYKQYTVRKSANNEKYIPKMLKSKKNEIANNLNNTLPASSCLLTAQYARSLTE